MKLFSKLMKDELGASAAEYALIIGSFGLVIVLSTVVLGGAVNTSMTAQSSAISDNGRGDGGTPAPTPTPTVTPTPTPTATPTPTPTATPTPDPTPTPTPTCTPRGNGNNCK